MPSPTAQADPASRPARILIVDDVPANRALLEECLAGAGYRTLSAQSGPEALEAVAAGAPDLILLDVRMPGMDGYGVCRRLKADEHTAFIPIVLLTALRDVEDRIQGFEAGADDFLSKPFNTVELLTRVRSLLRMKSLHDQVAAHTRRLEEMVAQRTAALAQALRDLQEMDRLKSEFLTNISHELRTPLTPILGYLPAILKGELGSLSPGQRQALDIVSRSVDRLHRLIEDLLSFMQWESGQVDLHLGPVSPQAVCQAGLGVVAPGAREKGVVIQVEMPPGLPEVWGDAGTLGEALGHLLGNAVKFTPPGGRVTLTARRVEGESGNPAIGQPDTAPEGQSAQPPGCPPQRHLVEIAVRDTGVGIPPEALPRIFDRFYQADSSATRRHGGTGLGLAIVKRILDAHGAAISAESQLGRGTRFTIRLLAAPLE